MKSPTYWDFAMDELKYMNIAVTTGIIFNAQIAQAQRIAALAMKHVINENLLNQNEVMMSHSLRRIYDAVIDMGIDIRSIRNDVMLLNNYHNDTRYPGKDAYLAQKEDIKSAVDACNRIIAKLSEVM